MATKRELVNILDVSEKTKLRVLKDLTDAKLQSSSERAASIKSKATEKCLNAVRLAVSKVGGSVTQRISVAFKGADSYSADILIDPAKVNGLGSLVNYIAAEKKKLEKESAAIRTAAAKLREDLTLYGAIPAVVKDIEKFLKA